MSSTATVVDGKVTNLTSGTTSTASSTSSTSSSDSTTLDKQAFLQLLVAQMKYQDPLEPTSNTEYVSQLAQFSSLEEMQNMSNSVDLQRATSLVGSLVTVSSTDSTTGETSEVTGKVDYVTQSGSKTYLSINDSKYELSTLEKVWDTDYADAYSLAYTWSQAYSELPDVDSLTADNASKYTTAIQNLEDTYNKMTTYQKTFISSTMTSGLSDYVAKMAKLGITINTDSSTSTSDSDTDTDSDDTTTA